MAMQQLRTLVSDQSPYQLVSAKTVFSIQPVQPLDPPSSPPPTSPLPPLPTIAHCGPVRNPSPVASLPRARPRRPPRPSASLSDLKPRTIQSPEIAKRQKSAVFAARVRSIPSIDSSLVHVSSSPAGLQPLTHPSSVGLLDSNLESTSNFSDDVIAALPRLFQRPSPLPQYSPLGVHLNNPPNENGDRLRAWQVYHSTSSKSLTKRYKSHKETRKPVARSALFMPGPVFPSRRDSLHNYATRSESHLAHASSTGSLYSPFQSPTKPRTGGESLQNIHHLNAALPKYQTQTYDKSLTSLPRPLSGTAADANDNKRTALRNTPDSARVKITHHASISSETIAFFSLPYSRTVERGLPITGRLFAIGNSADASEPHLASSAHHASNGHDSQICEEEQDRVLTTEELNKAKRKRLLWAIVTVSLVLIATAGILGGVVWKLNSL